MPDSSQSFLDQSEIIGAFLEEGRELLDAAEPLIVEMEKGGDDARGNGETINTIFRLFHSIKGGAGFLGLPNVSSVTHEAEALLDRFRKGQARIGSIHVDLFARSCTFLRGVFDHLEVHGSDVGLATATEQLKSEFRLLLERVEDTPEVIDQVPETSFDPATTAIARAGRHETIRVDVKKLDVLLDLVGELVIAEAMVAHNPDLQQLNGSKEKLERSLLQLDKITRDLQDIAMSVRMIPLAGTFQRMKVLVRDVARKSGKQVELVISGEETEVDKGVIEQITDPLIHTLRNAIDHGLELPDERTTVGKSPTGRLILEANYVGGEVWITIQDDGRGLNRERILDGARRRGLVEGDGVELHDDQVWSILFTPGFSTADTVTDISGRGVGMDVVRRNIESIRGKVDIRSEAGHGTTVVFRIPLTLAILDGMLFRLGGSLYAIPIIAIRESIRPTLSQITRLMNGREVVNLRGQLLPVIRLSQWFGIDNAEQDLERSILIVVENNRTAACIAVDEIIGQQQIVLKGLTGYVGSIRGISGCTILADGEISLVVDAAGIIAMAETDAVQERLILSEG